MAEKDIVMNTMEELKEELRSLETQFTQLYQKALHTPCYTKLSKGESITASILKDVHWKETEKIMVKRYGKPEEVAYLVRFLISDEANFINNSIIRIDGGQMGSC